MTAQIRHPAPFRGIPGASAQRLLGAAQALAQLAPAMASSIECVGVDGAPELVATAAGRIAATFDLVASVKTAPLLTVRFARH